MSLEDRFRQTLTAAIDEVRAKLEAEFQSALATVTDEAEQTRSAAVSEAKSALEADYARQFAAEKEALTAHHDSVLAGLQDATITEAARLRTEAEASLSAARAESDTALAAARAEAEQITAEAAKLREDVERASAAARLAEEARGQLTDTFAASAARMLDGVRSLDDGTALSDVLDTLTSASAQEAGRAAILVVKGDRLIGWRTTGFGPFDEQPRALETGTDDMGVLALAVNTGRAVVAGKGAAVEAPSFSSLGPEQTGLAVPLTVGGRTVAVVYADAGDALPPSPSWQAAVEVLVRHAGRCLEALTVQRAAQARASTARVGQPA